MSIKSKFVERKKKYVLTSGMRQEGRKEMCALWPRKESRRLPQRWTFAAISALFMGRGENKRRGKVKIRDMATNVFISNWKAGSARLILLRPAWPQQEGHQQTNPLAEQNETFCCCSFLLWWWFVYFSLFSFDSNILHLLKKKTDRSTLWKQKTENPNMVTSD